MANKENSGQTDDSRRALPRNRNQRDINHRPDRPVLKRKTNRLSPEERRIQETNAGQKDMFEDPLPDQENEIRYRQPLMTGFLQLVDRARNLALTNRQQLVHGAA